MGLETLAYDPDGRWFPGAVTKVSMLDDGDDVLVGLRAMVEQANIFQTEHPETASQRFEVFQEGENIIVRGTHIWSEEGWKPAKSLLDLEIDADYEGTCSGAMAYLNAKRGNPYHEAVRAAFSISLIIDQEASRKRCALRGGRTVRQHLLELCRQLEVQTGEPFSYRFYTRKNYPKEHCPDAPDVCFVQTVDLWPLYLTEKMFERISHPANGAWNPDRRVGYRVPIDPRRPSHPKAESAQYFPEVGMPDYEGWFRDHPVEGAVYEP